MEDQLPIHKKWWKRIPVAVRTLLGKVLSRWQNKIEDLQQKLGEAREKIRSLMQRIEELQKEVAQLRARLGQNSRNSSRPPSSDKPQDKVRPPRPRSQRKKGAQPGHPPHERRLAPPEWVQETIACKPTHCHQCNARLQGDDSSPERHQVWEIPPIQPEVSEYQLHTLHCPACGASTKGQLPGNAPRGCFGSRAMSLIAMLTGVYRLSKRQIQQILADVFQLPISTGQICRMQNTTSRVLKPCVAEVEQYVRNRPANVDETGWREGRTRHWLWVAATDQAVLFRIQRRRSGQALAELLGLPSQQVITSDRAKAYNRIALEKRQLCWAHLQRDFQAMIDRQNEGSAIGEELLVYSEILLVWWRWVREGKWSRRRFQRRLEQELRPVILDALAQGTQCGCSKTAATSQELLNREQALWTFAYVEGVEPTNNLAERELRQLVMLRKTSFGTDSPRGSRFIERIFTVTATCRHQGRNVLEFLTRCHQAYLLAQPPPSIFIGAPFAAAG